MRELLGIVYLEGKKLQLFACDSYDTTSSMNAQLLRFDVNMIRVLKRFAGKVLKYVTVGIVTVDQLGKP